MLDPAVARWLPELAIAAALAWGAGIRLYAVLLLVGIWLRVANEGNGSDVLAVTRQAIDTVLRGDEPINELHVEIDDRCFKLLALHQPMATDLRSIVAAVKINTDLERVGGDHGQNFTDSPMCAVRRHAG